MKPSFLFFLICLLLLVVVYACRKNKTNIGWCHVQCPQITPHLILPAFDSTETDTMYLTTYQGDSNFVNPESQKQIKGSDWTYFYPHYCYELTIPALARSYRIRGIVINNDSMHYQGHRCTSTICFSRVRAGIVNDSTAIFNTYENSTELIIKK